MSGVSPALHVSRVRRTDAARPFAEGGPLSSLVAQFGGGGKRVPRLSVWLVLGRLTISASPTAPTPSRPTRGKPGSGVIETVRGRLSVNQRSWHQVSGTRLDEPLAPSDVRVAGLV